jgi:diadenosine tetraphosphatase ApaH/serine/threonine PP2A family protein phosphatase
MDLDGSLASLRDGRLLPEQQLFDIFTKFKEVLFRDPTVQPVPAPVTIAGDVHGQLYDVFELFRVGGDPSTTRYLFLGDYVDRGRYSLCTLAYLVCLKLKYPSTICLLRGNHECRQINQLYGFYDECVHEFGNAEIYRLCNELFDLMPIAAVVAGEIFCVHGGLSPAIKLIDQIATNNRQIDLPITGPFADLAWSDPDEIEGWGVSQRGAGWLFGKRPAREFCARNKLSLICRAHQLAQEGYKYHHGGEQLLTVWSAPNYMYRAGNAAAVLKLGAGLARELIVFHAVPDEHRKSRDDEIPQYFA